jgi:hypothetical protein
MELKAKLPSAQLPAKENIGSLLAHVSGGENERVKTKRDLLVSTKSLAKALKTSLGSEKEVKLLEKANAHLQNSSRLLKVERLGETKQRKQKAT